jgi:hypothetical protein
MSGVSVTTRPWRTVRLQAGLVRTLTVLVLLVLAALGVRGLVTKPAQPTVVRVAAPAAIDQGLEWFAESFARAYLTWNAENPAEREAALHPYLSGALDADGGLQPAGTETVEWASAVGEQADGNRTLVTVAAVTSRGIVYLSVPAARDANGFMYVAGYPAFVGPPAASSTPPSPTTEQTVQDTALQAVVTRAVTNYLAGNQENLLADLTPNALVSLPQERLTITSTQQITWVVPGSRVAVEVTADDKHGDTWTLRYELGVQKLDRWYVRSIQVNPTFPGGA